MSFDSKSWVTRSFFVIYLAAIATLAGLDILADIGEGNSAGHLILEALVLLISLVGIVMVVRSWVRTKGTNVKLTADLQQSRWEADHWRQQARVHLEGLARLIDDQFRAWSLTKSESEVGLLILKGLSFDEIARVRQTSERTVRQQAQSIYRKAGLKGRAEFSAYFLEDLLLPAPDTPSTGFEP